MKTRVLFLGRGFAVIAGCVLTTMLPCGCASDPTQGYAWQSSYDETIRTVSVPIFTNNTYARGLELELTDAVIKEIQRSTPWRVAGPSEGQTELVGNISDSRLQRLSTNRDTGYSQELDVELTVDFTWKDRRTGKPLVARTNFTAAETFIPSAPVRERIEVGQHAAVQRMARDIVNEMRSSW